ncbi:Npun_R2821/Npun_R2822 family protein [Leptolyngbya sp. PCC 6406]|uniref:Npun_R2821/Npun_R2822 family protein n=1 Tax=Leptolyngbya sp. PCC 6406 TaxID=1173264 RepID=UPI0002AC0737|nr:Npun_R2821/Npun_R2822 family protein [Leptolyngbya sp. PCC 6406]
MTNGIYTLANDVVYDQLVALLNSIEVNVGTNIPVAVIAYDDRIERVKQLVSQYPSVTLLEDPALYAPWEEFSYKVWETHPTALQQWAAKGIQGVNRLGMNRRYAAFDQASPFERFIYLDGDTLVLSSLDRVFDQLQTHPLVVYDFQYKDPSHIYNVASSKLETIFPPERVGQEIFCAGFYGGQRGLFPPSQREFLVEQLATGDADVLYTSAPNQSVLNYMVMKSQIPVRNLAFELPENERTGNAVSSTHFQRRGACLYDNEAPLMYLHYIGVSSKCFQRLCSGENIDFPYRDIFLHYRYLKTPEERPVYKGRPEPCQKPPTRWQRLRQKISLK